MATGAEVRDAVDQIGRAIDRAREGYKPTSETARAAKLGDDAARVEVAAYLYAQKHKCPCGAAEFQQEHGFSVLLGPTTRKAS